jgi:hypothetical protein
MNVVIDDIYMKKNLVWQNELKKTRKTWSFLYRFIMWLRN